MWTAATIPLVPQGSECKPASIDNDPRLLPRFQALVPEMERQYRASATISAKKKDAAVQRLLEDGASRTRTGDLLGAIHPTAKVKCSSYAGILS
jgi:hypothetical protein